MKAKILSICSCFLFAVGTLYADLGISQVLVFSVASTTIMDILGPAPYFHLDCGEKMGTFTSFYSIETNESNKKISAYLDADMPEGTYLSVRMTPPRGARSLEQQFLSATPVDLVIEVSSVSQMGMPILYTFSVDEGSAALENTARIITYTVIDG